MAEQTESADGLVLTSCMDFTQEIMEFCGMDLNMVKYL